MWFSNLPLKFKVGITAFFIFIPTMIGGTLFFSSQVEKYVAKTAAGGLMNFVDAKQHGTIRFLGQNEKLAKQLAVLVKSAGAGTDGENIARSFFKAVVDIDTFDPRQHPFYNEIASTLSRDYCRII